MEVSDVVKIQGEDGRVLNVEVSDLEVKMLLTFAINELLSRGSISLLSDEDKAQLQEMQDLLESDAQGSA